MPGSKESSEIHLELIDHLKRISSSATNIARIFLETSKSKTDKIKKKLIDKNENSNNDLLENGNSNSD